MASDMAAFKRRLGLRGGGLVVVTPNWICDAKLYASYRKQNAKPESSRLSACRQWLRQRLPSAPSEAESNVICANFTFTAAGAESMADRMHRVAAALAVPVLDATALFRGRCDAPEDARHYPPLVPAEVAALERLLA